MRLGEILLERRLITQEDLSRALELQRERSGEKLGKILVDLGFVATRDVLAHLDEQRREANHPIAGSTRDADAAPIGSLRPPQHG